MKRKKPVSTQNKLCVGGISLSLQGSYKHIDKPKPQGQERDGLIMGPSILLIIFSFQQNLKTHINLVKAVMFLKYFNKDLFKPDNNKKNRQQSCYL